MNRKDELHRRIENDFCYHAPSPDQITRYNLIRERAGNLAHFIVEQTPVSREQSLALTLLEQATMMANAAIARNEHEEAASQTQPSAPLYINGTWYSIDQIKAMVVAYNQAQASEDSEGE